MEAEFIHHDCFVVKTERTMLIFDYWKDGARSPLDIDPEGRRVYVFVSHHHKDHFNRAIFGWGEHFGDIRWIISRDTYKMVKYLFRPGGIYRGPRPPAGSVNVLTEGQSYADPLLRVTAFGSTDIGNSYLVETEGKSIFHAGDLNAWIWLDESTPEEVEKANGEFLAKLEPLRRHTGGKIDLAMFPEDPHMGRGYDLGAREFREIFETGIYLPMHQGLIPDREGAPSSAGH